MFLMGELKNLLGLQTKQSNKGTFIIQTKFFLEVLNKYEMKDGKSISTPMDSNI